jgi:hypothetical protein
MYRHHVLLTTSNAVAAALQKALLCLHLPCCLLLPHNQPPEVLKEGRMSPAMDIYGEGVYMRQDRSRAF